MMEPETKTAEARAPEPTPQEKILLAARDELRALCARCEMAATHGLAHATTVLIHVDRAFAASCSPLLPDEVLAIKLAALLCNCDKTQFMGAPERGAGYGGEEQHGGDASGEEGTEDNGAATEEDGGKDGEKDGGTTEDNGGTTEKNGGTTEKNGGKDGGKWPNARAILEKVLPPGHEATAALALKAIGCVGMKANGNDPPYEAIWIPEILWPRWAHRLETLGDEGIVRAHAISLRLGAPLTAPGTPAPATAEEVWEAVKGGPPARAEDPSASLVDHAFERLLPTVPPLLRARNPYLVATARSRIEPLEELCLAARPGGVEARVARARRTARIGRALNECPGGGAIPAPLLERILEGEKGKIHAQTAPGILRIVEDREGGAAGRARFSCRYIVEPDQERAIRDALARAEDPSAGEAAFAERLIALWKGHDPAEQVLCVIQCGPTTQAVAVPKPAP